MSKTIKISSITSMAMTEDAGMMLRNEMSDTIEQEEKVILDFEGIGLFATPFFNASIGYFVLKLSPEKYNQQVTVINLSDLGRETYSHSLQNAVSVYQNQTDLDMVGKITMETIEQK